MSTTPLTVNQIRSKFLAYMKEKGHAVVPSASLVPENDPTTLFTGSGMQPMLPYLLGQPHPLGKRIADSQKSFRSQDIEEVGDNRHTTFFEMLGNWSFGDYFKEEEITWMWTFLIDELGLDPQHFYVTCFAGNESLGVPRDTFSAELWQKLFAERGIDAQISENPEAGINPGEKIFYFSEKKNWWSRSGVPANMPEGEPGGPDSEMFYDFDPDLSKKIHETSAWAHEPCHVNCDCGRFMELGNNVFMQYKKTVNGFEELPQMNVDHGSGLERIAAALRNDPDMLRIDVFDEPRKTIERLSGKMYGDREVETYAFRVVLDHLRAATFLIGDDVLPGNKDQMYFVRRLIRRAVRFARNLGVHENFTKSVASAFIGTYKDEYRNLEEKREMILSELDKEETKFRKTLENGIKEFEKIADKDINGTDSFNLLQSFGFPIELTEELAKERGIAVDHVSFDEEKRKHSEESRTASAGKFKGGLGGDGEMEVKYHTATHLLHEALRQVLGDHVLQKGSNITSERLRFDFSHGEKMTDEQKAAVEKIINDVIAQDLPVTREEVSYEEARARGAIGVFDAKYEDTVSIYTVGAQTGKRGEANLFSLEFCGGPHIEHTGVLGHFKIAKEEAVSAGVRRIKAVLE
ncbi:MAG: alanine--tRNA ligase [Candidatus Pacebacteria bacterium]|nr:alanine--tRNA ligase [Candidatus Paceibacterota bacterium]